MCYQAWPRFARRHMHSCICYSYNFPLAMKYLPCHSINSSIVEEGGKSQLSDRLKPATVLNLLIRCQKRSLLIISLFFNNKVTLLYLQLVSGAVNSLPIDWFWYKYHFFLVASGKFARKLVIFSGQIF